MKTIRSKNEVNGLLVKGTKKEIIDNVIGKLLKDIPGVIDYKIYIETFFPNMQVKTNILLMCQKEYELINVLDNTIQKHEKILNEQFMKLFASEVEIVLLYK